MKYCIVLLSLIMFGCASVTTDKNILNKEPLVLGSVTNINIENIVSQYTSATSNQFIMNFSVTNTTIDTPKLVYFRCHFYTTNNSESITKWNNLQIYGQQTLTQQCHIKLNNIKRSVVEINNHKLR
jgi:hypothetical protein